jgi:phosphoesterase RecJ-like protein
VRIRRDVAERLLAAGRVVLTTHVTPDADGLGSALALLRVLSGLGKNARFVNCSTFPREMGFLFRRGEFNLYDKGRHDAEIREADCVVATDIGGTKRLGKMEPVVREARGSRIVIDHHLYQNDCFDVPYIVTTASSTAELTFDLLKEMRVALTPDVAEPLYCGLVADTGGFAFEATSPRAHLIAAELVAAGARPQRVWRKLNCQKSLLKMKVLGTLLASLESEPDGSLVWCRIDVEFLRKWGIEPRDSFEIVNYFLFIKGVECGLLFMQLGSDKTKVSLRSAGKADVCSLATGYGGGGHRFAAGCTIDAVPFEQAIHDVLAAARREVERTRLDAAPAEEGVLP